MRTHSIEYQAGPPSGAEKATRHHAAIKQCERKPLLGPLQSRPHHVLGGKFLGFSVRPFWQIIVEKETMLNSERGRLQNATVLKQYHTNNRYPFFLAHCAPHPHLLRTN